MSSSELVQQTSSLWGTDRQLKLTILDGAKVDAVKGTICSVAAEQNRVLEVHGEDLSGDVHVGVGRDAVGPVGGDALAAVEFPGAVCVLLGTEEGRDGLEVGSVAVVAVGHELVEERGGSVEKQGQRTEEEVLVLVERLGVALQAVLGQVLAVEVALAGVLHHAEKGAVEGVVVSIGEEVIVSGKGGVGFELVVTVEAGLGTCEDGAE